MVTCLETHTLHRKLTREGLSKSKSGTGIGQPILMNDDVKKPEQSTFLSTLLRW
uniref:Uncharacterized protein n=1 Tax=Anguilla anguilla TaxID=7936 RepID=A0A0E9RDM3_ANGAN